MTVLHPHGSLGRYQSGCDCQPCKDSKAAYARDRRRQIAYGRWESYMPAEPCREHVRALMASGVTLGRVAVMAGLGVSTVQKLMQGTPRSGGKLSSRVLAKTFRAIIAVRLDLDALPGTAMVHSAGTRRRVQALACLGYSLKEQADAVGRIPANYRTILTIDQVSVATARLVRDLYDAWSMTPAPDTWQAERTRRWAEKNGWLLPLAWDEEWIDLTDDALQATVREQAEAMDDDELKRCAASRRFGDRSPLTVAACREYDRRRYRKKVAA